MLDAGSMMWVLRILYLMAMAAAVTGAWKSLRHENRALAVLVVVAIVLALPLGLIVWAGLLDRQRRRQRRAALRQQTA